MAKEAAIEKAKQLQKLENDLNKRGKGERKLIARADEAPNTFLLRRPSGIMQLDIDTGGGLPAGGLSYLSGPDNAGKTFMMWKYFAMQQRLYGDDCYLAYAATESAPDYFFARKCGVRICIPDEMIEQREKARKEQGLPAFTKEELKEFKTQTGVFRVVRGDSGEEILESVVALYESNLFNIIGLDSVSAIIPAAELAREFEEFGQQGAQATLLGKFAKRFYPLTNGLSKVNWTTLIFTAQVRANRKKSEMASYMAKYVDDYTTVGSYEMRHLKLIDLLISSAGYEKEKDKDAVDADGKKVDKKHVVGKTLRWKTQKGKAGTHDGIVGEHEIVFAETMDDIRSLIPAGIRYGVLKIEDKKVVHGEERWPVDEFVALLRKDFKAEMRLRQKINGAANVSCIYT